MDPETRRQIVHCENARSARGQMPPTQGGKRRLPAECLHSVWQILQHSIVRVIYQGPLQLVHKIHEILCLSPEIHVIKKLCCFESFLRHIYTGLVAQSAQISINQMWGCY